LADKLPDTEFLLNTRDWPQTSTWQPKKFPIFSFSKVVRVVFFIFFNSNKVIIYLKDGRAY
jgi:hypothetical protein